MASNTTPENLKLRAQLVKLFGDDAIPDIASAAAWDGTDLIYKAAAAVGARADGLKYVDFMRGQKLNSPRGPIMIDPVERDIAAGPTRGVRLASSETKTRRKAASALSATPVAQP